MQFNISTPLTIAPPAEISLNCCNRFAELTKFGVKKSGLMLRDFEPFGGDRIVLALSNQSK